MASSTEAVSTPAIADHPVRAALLFGALGVVFGDIGTSPIYAFREALKAAGGPSEAAVFGVLSLVFWAIVLVVAIKYVVFVMRADNAGEGGTMALLSLALPVAGRMQASLLIVGLAGASLFFGDAMITPAISVLSAVEGLRIVSPMVTPYVVPIAAVVLVCLFSIQSRGSGAVGFLFGPIMAVWFVTLAVVGLIHLVQYPRVLLALGPTYALAYAGHVGPGIIFAVLGSVFLALTGGEALYADMGHFGRSAIRISWFAFVAPALVLVYLGQGALVLADPAAAENPFFLLFPTWLLAPAILLTTAATVIASQAVLSGALNAREEVTQVADVLGAPVAKALLGKAVIADDLPFTTGGIGHLGTAPSSWAMKNCDAVFIVGSTMPWFEYYPKSGQARGVQIDMKSDRIGLRYPVEIGLVGDAKATLAALIPLLQRQSDRGFLQEAQGRMATWNWLLGEIETTSRAPLRPQMVIKAISDLMADDAVISLDCGANTHFAARNLMLRPGQRLTGTGMMASMAPGLPFAIAGQLAYPGRQSVAIVGDGGFAMLMAEMTTAVQHNLPVKIIVLKNNSLAEVKFEQIELGNPSFGCDLSPIDFVAFARACGAEGYRCERPEEVRPAI